MKKIKVLILVMFLTTTFSPTLRAQSLVPNPSFEIYDTCPNTLSYVYATGWSSYGNTPDYFNSCAPFSTYVSVPSNNTGYKFAATGNAYCGLFSFYNENPYDYREYIGSQLIDSLLPGHTYFISFKVSLANKAAFNVPSDKIGVRFSTIAYSSSSPPPLSNWAHVYAHNIIADTMNWTAITGSFVADSNYKYIIIGNFFDNAHTDTLPAYPSPFSYFCIDDVCVSTDSMSCNSAGEGVKEILSNDEIIAYPNPTERTFFIQSKLSLNIQEVEIYSVLGTTVKFSLNAIDEKKYRIDIINVEKGIYYIKLICSNQNALNKIILIN